MLRRRRGGRRVFGGRQPSVAIRVRALNLLIIFAAGKRRILDSTRLPEVKCTSQKRKHAAAPARRRAMRHLHYIGDSARFMSNAERSVSTVRNGPAKPMCQGDTDAP